MLAPLKDGRSKLKQDSRGKSHMGKKNFSLCNGNPLTSCHFVMFKGYTHIPVTSPELCCNPENAQSTTTNRHTPLHGLNSIWEVFTMDPIKCS